MMPAVKICGITRAEDASLAVQLGALAIGIVFWPGSPRCVPAADAARIVAALPDAVPAVGVFVNQAPAEVHAIAVAAGLRAIQLHGEERPAEYVMPGIRLYKAVAVGEDFEAAAVEALPPEVTPVLDACDPIRRGGTGRTIDWDVAARVARARPVVLSGGLHPGNVREAIDRVHPQMVDVSSGVESAPGIKDPQRMRAFFKALQG